MQYAQVCQALLHLPADQARMLLCRRAGAAYSEAQRTAIFKLWQAYEIAKSHRGDWDVPDLVCICDVYMRSNGLPIILVFCMPGKRKQKWLIAVFNVCTITCMQIA